MAICGDGHIEPGEECDDGNDTDWDGCTSCSVTEFHVNSYTPGMQYRQVTAMADDGRFVVVWQSQDQDGESFGVYARRYDASGLPDSTDIQVNTHYVDMQELPSVAMAPDGRFVVVWNDHDRYGIYGQLFNADGTRDGSEFSVLASSAGLYQCGPYTFYTAVAMAPDGRFVVVWDGEVGEIWQSMRGIFARVFDSSGNPVGDPVQVVVSENGVDDYPRVAMADDGHFVVVWQSTGRTPAGYAVFVQRFSPDGTRDGTMFQVDPGSQGYPDIAMAPDGRFVVVWHAGGLDGDRTGVFGQRFNPDGTRDGTQFQVNTYTADLQQIPAVAMGQDGRFVVVWQSYGQDSNGYGIFGQRFNPDGTRDGTEFQVNVYTADTQEFPDVAMDSSGRFVVTWDSVSQAGNDLEVFAQRYTADGTPLGSKPWP